jgi:hypothetical protein
MHTLKTKTIKAVISKMQSRRDSMSLESLKLTCEIIALVAVAVSVAAGAVALILGNRINKAQAEQLRQFDLALNTQKERTANAELTLLEVRRKLADRVLTDDQINAIAGSLKSFAGQEFEVIPLWDNKESVSIANRITSALRKAGWAYVEPEFQQAILGGLVGIKVVVDPNSNARTKGAAKSLISSLLKEGLIALGDEYALANNPKDNKIQIDVGSKY